ncbi:MAG: transketolase [Bacteroidales bacterium]|jgi:transketolase
MNISNLNKIKLDCLEIILKKYKDANAGHIGASLSCLDILVYLYFFLMNKEDRFILSKGHAALSLYVVLYKAEIIDINLLNSFYNNGTLLSAHPPCNRKLNGVTFGTGSLGHGLPLANGFSLSNRFTKTVNNVFCLISEGDCDEGSTWEAALFASQYKLKNLFVIIDNNNLQGFGKSNEVLNLEPLADKWKSFNFDVAIAENGNDFNSLHIAFDKLCKTGSNKPKCIIAETTKGSGISFMENKLEWHYLPMNDEQYTQAIKEIKILKNA